MGNISEVKQLLNEVAQFAPRGYAIALHVKFTTPKYLFQTYSSDWMNEYSRRGFVIHDPTVKWGLQNDGIVDWSDLADSDTADVLGQAKAFGLNFGVTMAGHEDGSKSIGSFSREDRTFSADEKDALSAVFVRLQKETAEVDPPDTDFEADLKRLSVELTHG